MREVNIPHEIVHDFLVWQSMLLTQLDETCSEVFLGLFALCLTDLISQGFVILVDCRQCTVPLLELGTLRLDSLPD